MNYEKLEERIAKKYRTHVAFGNAMGWSPAKLSFKLSGRVGWSQEDILQACDMLGISYRQIPTYFFTKNVYKE